jgi:hypothetical protein
MASERLLSPGIHTYGAREFLDGFGEAQIGVPHQESDSASMRVTAEAMIELTFSADNKRRCYFCMKWTGCAEIHFTHF